MHNRETILIDSDNEEEKYEDKDTQQKELEKLFDDFLADTAKEEKKLRKQLKPQRDPANETASKHFQQPRRRLISTPSLDIMDYMLQESLDSNKFFLNKIDRNEEIRPVVSQNLTFESDDNTSKNPSMLSLIKARQQNSSPYKVHESHNVQQQTETTIEKSQVADPKSKAIKDNSQKKKESSKETQNPLSQALYPNVNANLNLQDQNEHDAIKLQRIEIPVHPPYYIIKGKLYHIKVVSDLHPSQSVDDT